MSTERSSPIWLKAASPKRSAVSPDSKPTRLAFCITDLDPGGAERALVQLVTRLDRNRWQPSVICLAPRGVLADDLEQAGVQFTCLGARHSRNVGVVGRLIRQLRDSKPALLQTFLFHANIAGRIAGRLARVPKIVSGIRVAERRSRLPLWIDRMTQRLVDHNVCVSQAVADFSVERGGLSAGKITVIPNGVDAQRFATSEPADLSEFDIPSGSQTVLFVGRLDPQKGPFLLLEAVKGLLPTYPRLHVLMVGEGSLRIRLQEWIGRRDLHARVHLAGWRADVPQLLKAVDCLVLPSRWEGMPNVVLEAMAAGLPVLATEVEGTTELIQNHKTGLLVPPNSPRELAAGLSLLLGDPEQALAMSRVAQVIVQKNFTWDQVVEQFEALWTRVLRD